MIGVDVFKIEEEGHLLDLKPLKKGLKEWAISNPYKKITSHSVYQKSFSGATIFWVITIFYEIVDEKQIFQS